MDNNNYNILFKIEDLNQDYLQKIREKILVLKNNLLLQLVLNYSVKLANKKDVSNIISKINRLLFILSNRTEKNYTELSENKENIKKVSGSQINNQWFETYTYLNNENNKKYIKTHKLNAIGLIEAIIQFTVKYYDSNICPSLISMKIENIPGEKKKPTKNIRKRFQQKMEYYNSVNYLSLGYYIYELFNSTGFTKEQKIKQLKLILKKIAEKINELQNYGFIHGDFHSGNIYINKNNNEISFIDFGYSAIKLPQNNGKLTPFLLCVPISTYTSSENKKLRLPYDNNLKKIDLFHLIENLNSFQYSNENINSEFTNFINKIRSIYYAPNMKDLIGKRHKFTCSNNLDEISDSLDPEIFINEIKGIQ
jgi:serine/threonine protein kinase